MKPLTCQSEDKNCTGSGGENCPMCINRSIIAKEGYDLIRIIECVPASVEQTTAVVAAERFIKIAESAAQENAERCGTIGQQLKQAIALLEEAMVNEKVSEAQLIAWLNAEHPTILQTILDAQQACI